MEGAPGLGVLVGFWLRWLRWDHKGGVFFFWLGFWLGGFGLGFGCGFWLGGFGLGVLVWGLVGGLVGERKVAEGQKRCGSKTYSSIIENSARKRRGSQTLATGLRVS